MHIENDEMKVNFRKKLDEATALCEKKVLAKEKELASTLKELEKNANELTEANRKYAIVYEQVHLLSSNLVERDTKIRELEDNYTEMKNVTASKDEIIKSTDVALNTLRILSSDKDELIESQKEIINCLQNDRTI